MIHMCFRTNTRLFIFQIEIVDLEAGNESSCSLAMANGDEPIKEDCTNVVSNLFHLLTS